MQSSVDRLPSAWTSCLSATSESDCPLTTVQVGLCGHAYTSARHHRRSDHNSTHRRANRSPSWRAGASKYPGMKRPLGCRPARLRAASQCTGLAGVHPPVIGGDQPQLHQHLGAGHVPPGRVARAATAGMNASNASGTAPRRSPATAPRSHRPTSLPSRSSTAHGAAWPRHSRIRSSVLLSRGQTSARISSATNSGSSRLSTRLRVRWSAVRASGYEFAYIKATKGTTCTTPTLHAQLAGERTVRLVVGCYHFEQTREDSAAADRAFAAQLKRLSVWTPSARISAGKTWWCTHPAHTCTARSAGRAGPTTGCHCRLPIRVTQDYRRPGRASALPDFAGVIPRKCNYSTDCSARVKLTTAWGGSR